MRQFIIKLLKKLQRDGLLSVIIACLRYPFQYSRRKAYKKMLSLASSKEKFSQIYQENFWSSSESRSGEGSEVKYTESLRSWLPEKIKHYGIKTIVDAPCGDFVWMKLVLPKVEVTYFGFDIVDVVIENNINKYANKNINFCVADICNDKLPDCDLLIVRDCLFHLSYDDIEKFLNNISTLNYKYLLTTTHIVDDDNRDIVTGDFRLINLFKAPFCFSEKNVISRVDDYPTGYSIKREMVLVEKQNVPLSLYDVRSVVA